MVSSYVGVIMKIKLKDRIKFYKSSKWIKKRNEIIERDNNECQHCKEKGYATVGQTNKLDVHHIKHLENHWDLRLDDDNLITLCSSCHNIEHPEKLIKNKSDIHSERFE